MNVFDNRPPKHIWSASLLMTLFLSVLVLVFGTSAYTEAFYVFPIALASWYGSKKSGIWLASISVAMLFCVNAMTAEDYVNIQRQVFEGLSYLLAYLMLAVLITDFRKAHRAEEKAADTDGLTGIRNSRSFHAVLVDELARSKRYRHVFSIAYIDIDEFKRINDSEGHMVGDELLVEVADCLRLGLRVTDFAARLGGDEFACLFPETDQNNAKVAFKKIEGILKSRMSEHGWDVGFSVGLVTFEKIPNDVEEVLRVSDEVMYSVKNSGKGAISSKVWVGE